MVFRFALCLDVVFCVVQMKEIVGKIEGEFNTAKQNKADRETFIGELKKLKKKLDNLANKTGYSTDPEVMDTINNLVADIVIPVSNNHFRFVRQCVSQNSQRHRSPSTHQKTYEFGTKFGGKRFSLFFQKRNLVGLLLLARLRELLVGCITISQPDGF